MFVFFIDAVSSRSEVGNSRWQLVAFGWQQRPAAAKDCLPGPCKKINQLRYEEQLLLATKYLKEEGAQVGAPPKHIAMKPEARSCNKGRNKSQIHGMDYRICA